MRAFSANCSIASDAAIDGPFPQPSRRLPNSFQVFAARAPAHAGRVLLVDRLHLGCYRLGRSPRCTSSRRYLSVTRFVDDREHGSLLNLRGRIRQRPTSPGRIVASVNRFAGWARPGSTRLAAAVLAASCYGEGKEGGLVGNEFLIKCCAMNAVGEGAPAAPCTSAATGRGDRSRRTHHRNCSPSKS